MKSVQQAPEWLREGNQNTPTALQGRTKGQRKRQKERERRERMQNHKTQSQNGDDKGEQNGTHNYSPPKPVKKGWSGWEDNSNWAPTDSSFTGPVYSEDAYSADVSGTESEMAAPDMELMPPPSLIPGPKTAQSQRKEAFEKGINC